MRPRTTQKAEAVIGADRKAVIRAIRDARTRAGLTQEQAAGLRKRRATSTISRWETGGMPNTWGELIEYAHLLGQEIVLRFGPQPEKAGPDWDRLWRELKAIAEAVEASEDAADRSVAAVDDGTSPQPDGDDAPLDPKRPVPARE